MPLVVGSYLWGAHSAGGSDAPVADSCPANERELDDSLSAQGLGQPPLPVVGAECAGSNNHHNTTFGPSCPLSHQTSHGDI